VRTRFPDNRFRYIKKAIAAKEIPEHPTEQALYYFLMEKKPDEIISYAYELYSQPYERNILNSWLLAGATEEDIKFHLRIPCDVAHTYMHLFFDITQFRDELDIYSWVNELERDNLVDEAGLQLYKQALMGGLDAMAWIYSRHRTAMEPRKVLENIMADSYYRAKANRQANITSKAAKEAHSYMNTALKAGDLLAKHTPQQMTGVSDLVIKLETKDLTTPADDAKTEDLLH